MASTASTRYWLAQLPGYAISAAVLVAAWEWFGLPAWLALLIFALVVAKDVALYPLARKALDSPARSGAGALLGVRAVVVERLAPEGRVRVGSELWRAEARSGADIEVGQEVRVEAVHGLVLRVRPEG
jgi:membrane protein implicated in regulation of membrane protease activity